jgi:hypothetical protein
LLSLNHFTVPFTMFFFLLILLFKFVREYPRTFE